MKEDKDPVVKGIEKVLSFLPEDLTDEQKQKVEEIKDLLNKIDSPKSSIEDRGER